MKINRHSFEFLIFVFLSLLLSFRSQAQENANGQANNFTTVEYSDAPHQQQMKSRLSGAMAQPQPGGLLLIKQLKLETFDMEGKPKIIVTAPECVYDTLNATARSSGHLEVETGNGNFRVEGDGFLWRQSDEFLTISNHVSTVIQNMR